MTLDVYSDLFDDDLDAVGIALNQARSSASVGRSGSEQHRYLAEKPVTCVNR